VRRLEADLGFKLFFRKARGLALTDTGRNYRAPIQRALALIDDATRKLRPQNRKIIVSVTPSFASKWLVPRLGSFEQTHPDIEVQTVASEQVADFRTDRIDLAIRQGHPPFGDGPNTDLLTPLELCAVCSPAYSGKSGEIIQIEDFTSFRLIQDSHNHWDSLLAGGGENLAFRKIQFNQTAHAMDAAVNGRGIALVPRLLANAEIAENKLVEIWRDTRPDQPGYYIVSPDIKNPKPAWQLMIDWFLSKVGSAT
jgi:LysR family glycine cleavage system transcriptional activator